jgi:molecular chaperone IbpA
MPMVGLDKLLAYLKEKTMSKQLETFDLPSLQRVAFGFDNIFDQINRSLMNSTSNAYPPYNIIRTSENQYSIEVAVAGFAEDELSVDLKNGVLNISGETKTVNDSREFLFRGISSRRFLRTFTLADNVEVKSAKVKNGILTVSLYQVVPKEPEPTRIKVTFE